MSETDKKFDSCHCCQGISSLTPVEHPNRPGLSALAYRVGTHGSFKASMQTHLGTKSALAALGTRDDADYTIALVDAWSCVADVLSFYTERIANEGFLRTATEFRSTQELARTIGYQPRPGVAASTYLAFTVEDAIGAAEEVPISTGTRAQSSPEGDALPQTFETTEELLAHPEWNAIRPQQTETQVFNQDTRIFYFAGTNIQLSVGGWMILRAGVNADLETPGEIRDISMQIISVEVDTEKQHTRVELVQHEISAQPSSTDLAPTTPGELPPPAPTPVPEVDSFAEVSIPPRPSPQTVFTEPFVLSGSNVTTLAANFTWSSGDMELFEMMHALPNGVVAIYTNDTSVQIIPAEGIGIFAMRVETAPFGHNAPLHGSLPPAWIATPTHPLPGVGIYPNNWDDTENPWPINVSPREIGDVEYKDIYGDLNQEEDIILLEAVFYGILPGSWIVLKRSGNNEVFATFQVTKTEEVSRADFALNGKVTALTLAPINADQVSVDQFSLRTTTIYAQSEQLKLAGKPIELAIQGDSISLDHVIVHELVPGQIISISGTPIGVQTIVEHELAVIRSATDLGKYTKLVFEQPLQRSYQRDTVTLNANIVHATHGETRKEVLGGGDAAQAFQRFQLSHALLTYVSASVPGGAQSTLELRVNDVLWQETEQFFGLKADERRYMLGQDDQGKTNVVFGDGQAGRRLPTGFENVSASYRTGLGLAGNLFAGKITLLASQPRYVQAVTNPVPATGGEDPESIVDTRRNAPNSVRTFARIVSLQDFEDFARSYPGISKAQVSLLHLGEGNAVHLTIAGEQDVPVSTNSNLYQDLIAAMNFARDPLQRLLVTSYEPRFFDVVAKVRVHIDYQKEQVLKGIEDLLRDTFSFAARELGQGVGLSELMAVMQGFRGVEAIDIDRLRNSHDKSSQLNVNRRIRLKSGRKVPSSLLALPARRDAAGRILPAQHLKIYRIQLEDMS